MLSLDLWDDINREIARGMDLHGDEHTMSPTTTHEQRLAILQEEVSEVASALSAGAAHTPHPTEDIRAELTQVAAVAVSWLVALSRG